MTTATVTASQPPLAEKGRGAFYRPELDALRFFAFFGVFLFHFSHPVEFYVAHGIPRLVATTVNGLTQGGVFGVDLFFVLSAYLITELLLREKDKCGALDVRAFYIRRMLRIWPLYFFCIGLGLIPLFNPAGTFTWRYAVAYVLLASNWSIVAFGWPLHSIVGQLWTVSIEEQFYLLWPPIVRKLSRERIATAAIVMLVIAAVMRIVMVAVHGGMNSVWCNTFARLDPIAAGILLATTLRGRAPNFGLGTRVGMLCAGVAPLALVASFWHIHEPETLEWIPTLVGFPLVAIGCTLILLAVLGIQHQMPVALLYLGKISYGLYVYHALGNLLSNMMIPIQRSFLQLALRPTLAFAITAAISALSYAFLETPFLQLKKRFAHIDSRPV